ncbi:MAG: hypothetical protein AB2992_07255 (plasmid) [Candidatus Symbiodolus clandestinus]
MPYNLRHRVPINYTEVDDEPAETLDVANQNITVQCKSKKRKLSASFNDSRISNLDFKNDSSDYPIKRGRYADLDRSQGSVTTGEINIATSTPRTTSNVKRALFVNHDESIDQEQQKGQVANENLGKKYDVPGDGNCLFWSIFFAYLLPIKDDIKEFETRFRKMFPNSNDIGKVRQILCSLNLESLNAINTNEFIREFVQKLRKRAYVEVEVKPQIHGTPSRRDREHNEWAERMQNAQYDDYNVINQELWGEEKGLNALALLLDICIHEKQTKQKYPSQLSKYDKSTGEQTLLEVKSSITITLSLENDRYNFYYQDTSSNTNLKDSGLGNSLNSSVCEDVSIIKAFSSRKRKHPLDEENISPKVTKTKSNTENEVPVIKYKYSDDLDAILKQEIEKHSANKISKEKYQNRLHEELAIIKKFGYSENFLIAANIAKVCQYFKIRYQLVGSANSSLVAKLLDIHTMDPIENKLLFEVFLSRNHHPDFDFFIDSNQVHIIRDYLIKQAFPGRAGRMLRKDGSVHPSSIGIKPIGSSLKIVNNKFIDCSGSIDKEGFIKFDLLSSKELHNLDQICKQKNISSTEIDINDESTYQLIADGDVEDLFQLRNRRKICEELHPKCFDDLVNLLALNKSRITKNKKEILTGYQISSLYDPQNVFLPTKGIILFKEQIMEAANKYFGVSMNNIYQFLEDLKKVDNDKKKEYIYNVKIYEKLSGCEVEDLFSELQKASSVVFSKAHVVSLAKIVYGLAYVKCHYSVLFKQLYSKKNSICKVNDTSNTCTLNLSTRKSCVSLGVLYQIELIMLVLNRLKIHQYDFLLATEEAGTGKFDDITVRYQDQSKGIYIQAKHLDVEEAYNSINSTELFPVGKIKKCTGMFSI